ncbi:hypothetical protein [Thalassotalea agarivorans]|nr:hypothetical protein [Thalassotalea agarivorans]
MAYPKIITAICGTFTVFACAGIFKVYMSHDDVRWYPESHPTRIAVETLDENVSGSRTLEVYIDTGMANGLYDRNVLLLLEDIELLIGELEVHGIKAKKMNSILNVIKQTHQTLNENKPEFYSIPETRALIAQELLLFENSGADSLKDFTDN